MGKQLRLILIIFMGIAILQGCAIGQGGSTSTEQTNTQDNSYKVEITNAKTESTNAKTGSTNEKTQSSLKNLSDLKKDGFEVIEEQSFDVNLENWGKVRFISGASKNKFNIPKVNFYLIDSNETVVYSFLETGEWAFWNLDAISFKDVNKDGLKDVLVIAEYITGVGEQGAVPFPAASIYFQKGKEFVVNSELNAQINSSGKNKSINAIIEFLENKKLPIIDGSDSSKNIDKINGIKYPAAYTVVDEVFSLEDDGNSIKITYPQINNMGDKRKQKKINDLIKNEALKKNCSNSTPGDALSYEKEYKIKFKSENVLSILLQGDWFSEGAMHPNEIFETINIDIKNEKIVRLRDIVKIDIDFADIFRRGKVVSPYSELDEKSKEDAKYIEMVKQYASKPSDEELIKMLKSADTSDDSLKNVDSDTSMYLTENAIGVSIVVPHAYGDYSVIEVKYEDIIDNINNEIWNDFNLKK